ncbi:hypothetical protein KY289_022758 [Solanum tuberosum]|nr:hypothetical protein KY289_022758 [Solanum tuberosum]
MAMEVQQMKGNSQRGRKQGQGGGKTAESSKIAMESSIKTVGQKDTDESRNSVEVISTQFKHKASIGREKSNELVEMQSNGTVPCKRDLVKEHQKLAEASWKEITLSNSDRSPIDSRSSKQSWADEVEEEDALLGKPKSIWDNFDIAKLSNAGYKLDYVTPTKKGDVAEIKLEDIKSEILYWGNAVVCYVLGAHPPFQVIQGYIQRLWGKHGIDKVAMLRNGVIVVRFETVLGKQEVLQGGIYHFDNKPFIVKEWTQELEFTKEELETVPIWIKFPGLDFKYWSKAGLSKIGSLIGKPMMVDHNTEARNGLNFARILVEVELGAQLPDVVKFKNEKGKLIEQTVQYDWKPTLCKFCKKYGHDEEVCRVKKKGPKPNQQNAEGKEDGQNKKWQSRAGQKGTEIQQPTKGQLVDKEATSARGEWQTPTRVGKSPNTPPGQSSRIESTNSFQILQKKMRCKLVPGLWVERLVLSLGMVNLLSWNVRGLNGSNKQKEVKILCNEEKAGNILLTWRNTIMVEYG